MTTEERRRNPRVSIQQFIELSYDRETYLTASAQDLSEEGIRVRTNERLDVGTRVFVMFGLKQSDGTPVRSLAGSEVIVRTEGIVMHATPDEGVWTLGIKFEDIDPLDRGAVMRFLSEQID